MNQGHGRGARCRCSQLAILRGVISGFVHLIVMLLGGALARLHLRLKPSRDGEKPRLRSAIGILSLYGREYKLLSFPYTMSAYNMSLSGAQTSDTLTSPFATDRGRWGPVGLPREGRVAWPVSRPILVGFFGVMIDRSKAGNPTMERLPSYSDRSLRASTLP